MKARTITSYIAIAAALMLAARYIIRPNLEAPPEDTPPAALAAASDGAPAVVVTKSPG